MDRAMAGFLQTESRCACAKLVAMKGEIWTSVEATIASVLSAWEDAEFWSRMSDDSAIACDSRPWNLVCIEKIVYNCILLCNSLVESINRQIKSNGLLLCGSHETAWFIRKILLCVCLGIYRTVKNGVCNLKRFVVMPDSITRDSAASVIPSL